MAPTKRGLHRFTGTRASRSVLSFEERHSSEELSSEESQERDPLARVLRGVFYPSRNSIPLRNFPPRNPRNGSDLIRVTRRSGVELLAGHSDLTNPVVVLILAKDENDVKSKSSRQNEVQGRISDSPRRETKP